MPLGIYNSFGDFALFFISSFFNIIIIIVISFALLYKNHITTSRSYPDNNHLKISRLIPFFPPSYFYSFLLFVPPLIANVLIGCQIFCHLTKSYNADGFISPLDTTAWINILQYFIKCAQL